MKHLLLFGAFAFASLGLAGSAAAACNTSHPGLMSGDTLIVCVLEHDESSYPPYSSNTDDIPAAVYYYTYKPGEYQALGAELYQYAGESCWSCGGNPNTYSGWQGDVYFSRYAEQYTTIGAYLGQYQYANAAGDGAGTYGGAYLVAADHQVSFDLYQDRWNAGCEEQAWLSVDWEGMALLGPRPCTVELPQLPRLPSL